MLTPYRLEDNYYDILRNSTTKEQIHREAYQNSKEANATEWVATPINVNGVSKLCYFDNGNGFESPEEAEQILSGFGKTTKSGNHGIGLKVMILAYNSLGAIFIFRKNGKTNPVALHLKREGVTLSTVFLESFNNLPKNFEKNKIGVACIILGNHTSEDTWEKYSPKGMNGGQNNILRYLGHKYINYGNCIPHVQLNGKKTPAGCIEKLLNQYCEDVKSFFTSAPYKAEITIGILKSSGFNKHTNGCSFDISGFIGILQNGECIKKYDDCKGTDYKNIIRYFGLPPGGSGRIIILINVLDDDIVQNQERSSLFDKDSNNVVTPETFSDPFAKKVQQKHDCVLPLLNMIAKVSGTNKIKNKELRNIENDDIVLSYYKLLGVGNNVGDKTNKNGEEVIGGTNIPANTETPTGTGEGGKRGPYGPRNGWTKPPMKAKCHGDKYKGEIIPTVNFIEDNSCMEFAQRTGLSSHPGVTINKLAYEYKLQHDFIRGETKQSAEVCALHLDNVLVEFIKKSEPFIRKTLSNKLINKGIAKITNDILERELSNFDYGQHIFANSHYIFFDAKKRTNTANRHGLNPIKVLDNDESV